MTSTRGREWLLALGITIACGATRAAEVPVWFGTYTNAKTGSEGIYTSRFDTDTGALAPPVLAAAARNPSFLAFHPRLPVVYAVAEVPGPDGKPVGGVAAFTIDEATARLTPLGSQPSGGGGPCHVTVDAEGRVVLAANYGGGSVICLGLDDTGRPRPVVAEGERRGFIQHTFDRADTPGIDPRRQDKPHAHSVDVSRDGRFVVVCDLGVDQVFVHALDARAATIAPHTAARAKAGAGPRHFAWHPGGRFAYAVNELDLTVTAFAHDAAAGTLTPIETLSTLPADVGDRAGFTAAEIAVHPTGKFVYASTRGHDSIAIYAIDAATGRLSFRGTEPVRGRIPRHFAIAPGGKFLLAAGQDSGTVAVFAIDQQTGGLTFTGTSIEVPAPVCVAFRPSP
jgi:6-phosphogluconolactonase